MRIWLAGRRLGRIGAALPVHAEELFGLRVIGLEDVIPQRPSWRNAFVMDDLAEVFAAQAEQGSAVNFGVAADAIVQAGMEGPAVAAVPGFHRLILAVDKNRFRAPVVALALEIVAALQEQDAFAGRGKTQRQCPATGAGTDDDEVVPSVGHCRFHIAICTTATGANVAVASAIRALPSEFFAMTSLDIAVPLIARILLVILFPFSAFDKILGLEWSVETGELELPAGRTCAADHGDYRRAGSADMHRAGLARSHGCLCPGGVLCRYRSPLS